MLIGIQIGNLTMDGLKMSVGDSSSRDGRRIFSNGQWTDGHRNGHKGVSSLRDNDRD